MALAENALTTVATAEDELGISSGTETARLQRLINEASAICEEYAGRVFYRDTAIAETVIGGEGPYLFVARPPINSITSITFLGDTVSSGDYEIHEPDDTGIIYALGGSWARLSLNYNDISRTPVNGMQRKGYIVTYDGGWYTQAQDDADGDITRTLPYSIERACLYIVSHLRRSMGRDPALASESLLSSSVSYRGGNGASSGRWLQDTVPGAADILNRYKTGILR